jgi:nickel/cobalt transporter (NicO) family protein
MMAAFIVVIRGTVAQAALLGLAATISHTLVIWGALGGMYIVTLRSASLKLYSACN